MNGFLQITLILLMIVALAYPLGIYISKTMDGENRITKKILGFIERLTYRFLRMDPKEEMDWKEYLLSIVLFTVASFVVTFVCLFFQNLLFLNPVGFQDLSWSLAFNTTVSFVTNTNWQAYSGETTMSMFSQLILTVQQFTSAAVGISVLFAFIRGLKRKNAGTIGNFYADMTRSTLYVLLPLSFVSALVLVSQGVPQNFSDYTVVQLLEPILKDGQWIMTQIIPQGPIASMEAIKMLGSNGGGFFGTNSAFPLENPTMLSNLVEMISIMLIPMALCFSFGRSVGRQKAGWFIWGAMMFLLVCAIIPVVLAELHVSGGTTLNGLIDFSLGNMEGKEVRFGVLTSSLWSVFTTAVSNGGVNGMFDSYLPASNLVLLILMDTGEVVFGGVGSGLCTMIAFVILTVFISGLMIGRTPEYLGKKIEPKEILLATAVCLATPFAVLIFGSITALMPSLLASISNGGAHGFSEFFYAFSSAGANNGSAMAGFFANTDMLNVGLGLTMLVARFLPIVAIIAMAGSLARKKVVAQSSGTLNTESFLFTVLLVAVVVIVGALSFLPSLALGPVRDMLD